ETNTTPETPSDGSGAPSAPTGN
ncbi:MAG: hypothetical protein K0R09_2481, partial [Clostridiales bacterium]|nr:hypothetical protein [Clostridiales bacterium]